MRHQTSLARSLVIFSSLALGTIVPCLLLNCSDVHKNNTLAQSQTKSDDVLTILLPNGNWADVTQLNKFKRSEAIKVLRDAETNASGERALSIVFLLAALGDDYEGNRKRLVDALRGCGNSYQPEKPDCYFVADYLMELVRRGDTSLLPPIFDVSDKADGAFSESLGGFYSDTLKDKPTEFLTALNRYSKDQQRSLCRDAGWEDGSGMEQGRFRDVAAKLTHLAHQNSSLSAVAKRCLAGVSSAYNEASENNRRH